MSPIVRPVSVPRLPAWGGARRGAGRPKRGPIASEPHKRRGPLARNRPVRVTTRIERALATLPRRIAYAEIRAAAQRTLSRPDFRIVHLVIRAHRLELVVEADHARALARGMQSLLVSAARGINRAIRRRGRVFVDRYRPRMLLTRAAVRALLHISRRSRRHGSPAREERAVLTPALPLLRLSVVMLE